MLATFNREKLRSVRKKMDMTQEDLAEKCNTSDRYIRALENGKKRKPSAELLCLICHVLKISMDDLMDVKLEE